MARKASKKLNETIPDSCEMTRRRVKNFLNNEVRQYATYVLETRTMPSIMDGQLVGARKILWAAMVGDLSKKNKVKMPAILGDTMKLEYAHGDASLANTTVNLCCVHRNKYSPLEAIGQIPSLRVPKCDTAVRYLSIRKSQYLEMFKYDKELLEIKVEEGEKIEPKFFLPIVPMQLLIRTSSPGYGFAYKSQSYKLEDIIDNVIQAIYKGTCVDNEDSVPLRPEIVGVKDENIIYNANKNRWYNVGEYTLDFNNDLLTINDLPYDVSFEQIEETLQTLKDKYIITDWSNRSEKEKIKYFAKFPRGRLEIIYNNNPWVFFKTFKLISAIREDILSYMDEDGKTLLFFDNAYQLIDAFVKKRLTYYDKRKTLTIKKLEELLIDYKIKINFIRLVVDGKLIVFKRKRSDIKKDLDKYNIPDYVLDMRMYNLTEEEIIKLENKIIETEQQLEYIKKTTIQEMYLDDIIKLREKIIGITDKTTI